MEAKKDVKSLAAMFEKKTSQPPPLKKAAKPEPKKEAPPASDVKNLASVFERKTTVKLDQDKGKFLSNKAQ